MSSNRYEPIPVDVARQISAEYSKSIVIICAWDRLTQRLHTTTYGADTADKIAAAKGGELCAQALGMNLSKAKFFEDFRTIDAARNARIRDLAVRAVDVLRSYQYGNSEASPAADMADAFEAELKKGGKQ